ncbi:MAG: PD-(D/E)XK nuclease family protein [Pseudanabaenaceae cyanobacterium]
MLMHLSAQNLRIWQTCRRQFQYCFIEELGLPISSKQQKSQELGRQFHLLVQQLRLGLPVKQITDLAPELKKWLEQYQQYPPPLILGMEYVEHQRSIKFGSYMLTGIYDLLILGQNQAQIVDWKTHQIASSYEQLKTDWQTCLYLYLLKSTTDYLPTQISMTYWFANAEPAHKSVTIRYDDQWHWQIHKQLLEITTTLTQQLLPLPALTPESQPCQKCEFNYRCHGEQLLPDIEAIPEVAI